jgi:hypothetical protein
MYINDKMEFDLSSREEKHKHYLKHYLKREDYGIENRPDQRTRAPNIAAKHLAHLYLKIE